jgi:hypothetical protein
MVGRTRALPKAKTLSTKISGAIVRISGMPSRLTIMKTHPAIASRRSP